MCLVSFFGSCGTATFTKDCLYLKNKTNLLTNTKADPPVSSAEKINEVYYMLSALRKRKLFVSLFSKGVQGDL